MFEGDWINEFMDYTSGINSPYIFRLWSAIGCVAASLERRVWVVSAGDCVHPSMYTLLVGKPGSGKSQAIRQVSNLWYSTKDLKIAPNSVTKASLTDELEAAKRTCLINATNLYEYHSLQIAASEFGVLVPAHDLDFLNFLNQIYDNDPNYRESRRTGARKVETVNPQINILAGTQPAYLATLLPEEAWGLGFMTRMIMVYSAETVKVDLFAENTTSKEGFNALSGKLKLLLKAFGEATWEPEAKDAIRDWYNNGCPPEPDHSRLISYNTRRILHALRLCLVSAASGGHPNLITHADFIRATDWLIGAESTMPDIFKEMVQRSDGQIIQELHMFVWQIWAKTKKPVHESRLVYFLQAKVTSDKIARIIDIAVRANILYKDPNAMLYTPRPRNEHGVE
jgi:hypothetical protein